MIGVPSRARTLADVRPKVRIRSARIRIRVRPRPLRAARWCWALAIALANAQAPRPAAAGDAAGAAGTNGPAPSVAADSGQTAAPQGPAEPAPMSAAARALYEEGLGLYAARDFAAAIRRFEQGFAQEPRREFLFAQAQAFRLAGDCAHAVPLYQRFLKTEPSSIQVDATRMGLDRCDKQEATARATAARTSPDSARPRPETRPPAPPPRPEPEPPRWWLDAPSLAAIGAGVVALGVGVGFVIASSDALDRARSPSTATHDEYDRLYDLAEHRRTIGIVAVLGGAAAAAGGLARLAFVRHRAHAAERAEPALLTFVPSTSGATLLWQGSY